MRGASLSASLGRLRSAANNTSSTTLATMKRERPRLMGGITATAALMLRNDMPQMKAVAVASTIAVFFVVAMRVSSA